MINLIAACDLNLGLGFKNQLLTKLPNDMKHFRKHTEGNYCVMGRKTYQSIGKPLPQRYNIILSHNTALDVPSNVFVYHSVDKILHQYNNYANKGVELYICGGAEVYKQFLPHADRIYLTIIENQFSKVDSYFPAISLSEWRVTEHIENKADEKNIYDHHFITYNRKKIIINN